MSSPPDEYPNDLRRYPIAEAETEQPPAERLRARALADLGAGNWAAAEQGFTALLTRGGPDAGRDAVAVVGVAHARLFGRLDTRGAFAMLQGVLRPGAALEGIGAARLEIVAAFLFATVDGGLCDPARAERHAAAAVARASQARDPELLALALSAELLALTLKGDAQAFVEAVELRLPRLELAQQPVNVCLRLELLALAALARGDAASERAAFPRALELASALGFAACEARLQACSALRSFDAARRSSAAPLPPPSRPSVTLVSRVTFPGTLQAELARLAPSRVSVLLVGGSRSLRDDAARALHELSPRVEGPYVSFDCAALDSDAVERGLFGGPAHERGVAGAIHAAETGTLHVSAVHELPLLMQPRFLRFLDQQKSVRVVASTVADLDRERLHGHFREDLAERLLLVQVTLPKWTDSV